MLIGKNWKIEADSFNIILSRKTSKKHPLSKEDATDRWHAVGYYATFQNALKDLVNYGVLETELKDLETIIAKLDELHSLIDSLALTRQA